MFFKLKGEKSKGLLVTGSWQPNNHLEEGQAATMLAKQDDIDLSKITCVVVNDATGRSWRGKIDKK